MSLNSNLDTNELTHFVELIHESLSVRTHFEFFLWFQGNLQRFIPHEIMIAAWGDFSLGLIYFDVVSAIPGVRTNKTPNSKLSPLLRRLFTYWLEHGKSSFALSIEEGIFKQDDIDLSEVSESFNKMKSALVHAIKDYRGHHDCLYVLLSEFPNKSKSSRKMLEAVLPYIDFSLRQLDHLPEQLNQSEVINEELPEEIIGSLSEREIEIMKWVKLGKTNQEIAQILDISFFTVKNHLQRIFKKLDVLNRAQAVTNFKEMYPNK
jgi:transcriptional regulator EpsA